MKSVAHTAWTLWKGGRTLCCTLQRHPVGGLELRALLGEEQLRSQVFRSQDDMLAAQEKWRSEAESKGWRAEPRP